MKAKELLTKTSVGSKTETSTKGSSGTRDSSTLPPPVPPRPLTPEGRRRKAERKAKMDKAFKEMLANWGENVAKDNPPR